MYTNFLILNTTNTYFYLADDEFWCKNSFIKYSVDTTLATPKL